MKQPLESQTFPAPSLAGRLEGRPLQAAFTINPGAPTRSPRDARMSP